MKTPSPIAGATKDVDTFTPTAYVAPFMVLPYTVAYVVLGAWGLALFTGTAVSLFIAIAVATRVLGPRLLIKHLLLFLSFLVVFVTSGELGGLTSITAAWYSVVPIMAFIVMDRRGFLQWCGVFVLGAFAALTRELVVGPGQVIPADWVIPFERLSFLVFSLGLTTLVGVALLQIERARQEASALVEELAGEITQRRDAEEQANEAAQSRSRFLATMSHEIRTPLHGMLGMTELLLERDMDAKSRAFAEASLSSGRLLLSLLNDVLDFSKLDADALELEQVDLDLTELLLDSASAIGPKSKDRSGISVVLDLGDRAVVQGDPLRLRQIVLNLLSNAVKFTRDGVVTLRARALEDGVRIEVEDEGTGIPPAARAQLFQPFVQADSSTTRKHGGTGLGLAIVKALVDAMGGTLSLWSEVDVGTRVTVELPLPAGTLPDDEAIDVRVVLFETSTASASQYLPLLRRYAETTVTSDLDAVRTADVVFTPAHPAHIRALRPLGVPMVVFCPRCHEPGSNPDNGVWRLLPLPARPSQVRRTLQEVAAGDTSLTPRPWRTGSTVLVVDDNLVNLKVARGMLERCGLRVLTASSGDEALTRMEPSVDLVLMDCQMPGMSGYEASRALHDRLGNTTPPILAFSASVQAADRVRATESGMVGFVSKPLPLQTLEGVLSRWLPALPEDQPLDAAG